MEIKLRYNKFGLLIFQKIKIKFWFPNTQFKKKENFMVKSLK